jgi:hypothetical protein
MLPDYEISIPHFYSLEYRVRDRVLLMEIDFRDPVIYLEEALVTKWEEPYAGEAISPDEKKRILANVYDYLVRQRGFKNVDYGCANR